MGEGGRVYGMEAQRRKGGKKGRRKSKEFMDAAMDAYMRHLALQKWREVIDLHESAGVDTVQAVREAGHFPQRGVYQSIWERWWQSEVGDQYDASLGSLFGCIEAAVQGAMRDEIAARHEQRDVTIEDTLLYKEFIDQALDRLFEEEAGSIEEL